MAQLLSIGWLTTIIRRPAFWLLVVLMVLITIPHYGEEIGHPAFLTRLMDNLDLERHAFERILYLVPIIWAGFLLHYRGALIVSLAALACMLPRAIVISETPTDAVFEASAVFIVGNVVAFTFESLHKERKRRIYLAALNQTASVVSQSLELSQVLNSSIDNVMDVMRVDAALVFLVEEGDGELTLTAYKGVSRELAQGVDRIKVGEGFNGMVAETGEPLYVEDASQDPSLTRPVVKAENIGSQLIVPLQAGGKVVGTLCVAMRGHREFRQDEMELLTAIGNQIGVAVENARLYQQERRVTEQLRASKQRYQELFENAHDAIWVHDLEDNIIQANKSFTRLTGYTLEELRGIKAGDLIAEGGEGIPHPLVRGDAMGRLTEVTLIKKDGSEASLQLSTNPVFWNGQVVAFQHIARDVTEEKRMKDNLRFHLQQITRSQEEERKRIARDLHDETIQALVVLSRQLDDLSSSGKGLSKDKRLLLENLRQQTNSTIEGVRHLSRDLRPPTLERLGLLPALEWLASDVGGRSGITVEVKAHGAERRLSDEIELVLFRIAQEALTNVWRHSAATSAQLMVEFDEGTIRIAVKDNGKGFDLPQTMADLVKDGKLGLAGMQERTQLLGGRLTIESGLGKGTSVTIEARV